MRERKADQKEHDGEQRRERHGVDKLVLSPEIPRNRLIEKTHPFLFYVANITLFRIIKERRFTTYSEKTPLKTRRRRLRTIIHHLIFEGHGHIHNFVWLIL